jgi:hypothetical protein
MNTEQRIAELEKELADVKRAASNEIYTLKQQVRHLQSSINKLI